MAAVDITVLESVLENINNWFVVGKYADTYTIERRTINLPFLQSGQYFRVVGSVFNDGLYCYSPNGMTNETFNGEIWALAVPPAVIALSIEIAEWIQNNPNNGMVSESFGGYTYNKGSSNGHADDWNSVFRSKLNSFRKLS